MDLTPEEAGKRAWLLVEQQYPALRERYLLENAESGMILDSDRAKELFPDYAASLVSRRQYASAVYQPAAGFINRLYEEMLMEPIPEGRERIVLCTAGGPGSGKSSAVNSRPRDFGMAAMVLDGTFSDIERARNQIRLAHQHGFRVQILFIYRPLRECLQGVWERAMSLNWGRATPYSIVIAKHRRAIETIQQLQMDFPDLRRKKPASDQITCLLLRFNGLDEPTVQMSWEEFAVETGHYDLASARALAYEVLNEYDEWHASSERRAEAESLRSILAGGLG